MFNDEYFLRVAIQLAKEARVNGEDPFGAVLVYNNKIVHSSCDKTIILSDPTSHAELNVISEYCRMNNFISLKGYSLYSSTEPCSLCSGAIKASKISKVVFSLPQKEYQQMKKKLKRLTCEEIVNQDYKRVDIIGPLLIDEGIEVFKDYKFQSKEIMHHQKHSKS